MRIILQEKIVNLGDIGDQVTVREGYARNYLFPYGKAVPATSEHIAEFEKRREALKAIAVEVLMKAEERAKAIQEIGEISLLVNASEEGKLFGSVGVREIVEEFGKKGIEIEKREVNLPQGPIRQIGQYDVNIQLHSNVKVTVKISVQEAEA